MAVRIFVLGRWMCGSGVTAGPCLGVLRPGPPRPTVLQTPEVLGLAWLAAGKLVSHAWIPKQREPLALSARFTAVSLAFVNLAHSECQHQLLQMP